MRRAASARGGAYGLPLIARILLVLWVPGAGCTPGAGPHRATRHVVEITAFAFEPDTLRVAPGDTVVWINKDVVVHTATEAGGVWDSRALGTNGTWTLVTGGSGESSYLCTLHPSMRGLIVVR